MKYKIILTEQADTDLRCICEYIAFTLLEPGIASGQLDRIEKGILSLDEIPERFRSKLVPCKSTRFNLNCI